MKTVSFGQDFDEELELQNIERQRRTAELLRQQSAQPLQGQQAGQVYVGPHWTQGLAKVLQAYAGRKADEGAAAQQKALAQALGQRNQQEVQGFTQAMQGAPGRGANEMDNEAVAATPPDQAKALAIALGSKQPMLQGMGQQMFTQQFLKKPQTPKWEKVEKPNADGTKTLGFVDLNSPSPWETFRAGGTAPVKREYVEGQAFNPYTGEQLGEQLAKRADPPRQPNPAADLLIPDPNNPGKMIPNTQLVDIKRGLAKAGASNVGVSVNTATKPFLQEIGKGVGEAVTSAYTGAQSAVQTLQNAQQIEQGLGNVIAGPMANQRVKLSQIGQVLGINGKDATEQLQNTRAVVQGLARQEMAAAAGMKGQGQITESERAILRRAESGDIAEMTVPEIKTLLGAVRKTANYRINLHNQNLNRLRQDPNAAGVVDYMRIDPPNTGTPQGFKILGVE